MSPGFVQCDGKYFTRDGHRFFPLGVNYLPSYLCGDHFSNWRDAHIKADLDHIQSLGLDCVRVAVFWSGFEPRQGEFSTAFLDAFGLFVAECKRRGILVMPVFLIGTWTGIYDAPYWKPPGMYQGEMLELEAAHVSRFVRRFAEEPSILCWDLSDEPWYLEEIPAAPPRRACGAPPTRRDVATNWVARLCRAIRAMDRNHLVTLGSDPEPVRKDTGFALEEMAQHLDVMAYCIYPAPSHGAPLDLVSYGAFQTRFFACGGKPAFLHEGPGVSSCAAGEEVVAARFRAWIYSALANGNTGILPWCYTDYQADRHFAWPLDDKPQEPSFGIFHADRTPKPRAAELLRFAKEIRQLPLDELELERPRAAIVYPQDYYDKAEQFHPKLWRHFTLIKGANIGARLVREDCLPSDASLIIVPGLPLRLSTWETLRHFVEEGGSLCMIMDDFFCLNPIFAQLFGVETLDMRPGTVDAAFKKGWGWVRKGARFAFRDETQRLWVKPTEARVIAAFSDDLPFLLEHRLGRGTAFLATFPFPLHLDLGHPHSKAVQTSLSILRQIRDLSHCTPSVDAAEYWIETAVFESTTRGDDWAVIVNWDDSECRTRIRVNAGLRAPRSLHLEPNGAILLKLPGARASG